MTSVRDTGGDAVVVPSAPARAVAVLWALVAVVLLVAGIVLLIDEGRVWFELPGAPVAALIAVRLARMRCVFDVHGVLVIEGRRQTRTLWPAIRRVEVRPDRWRAAVILHPVQGPREPLSATAWLSAARRRALAVELAGLARPHGVEVDAAGLPPA